MGKQATKKELFTYPLKACLINTVTATETYIQESSEYFAEETKIYTPSLKKISSAANTSLTINPYLMLALSLAIAELNQIPPALTFSSALADHFLYQLVAEKSIYSLLDQEKQTSGIRKVELPASDELSVQHISRSPRLRELILQTFMRLARRDIPIEFFNLFLTTIKAMQTVMLASETQATATLLETFRAPRTALFQLLSTNCKSAENTSCPTAVIDIVLSYDSCASLFQ